MGGAVARGLAESETVTLSTPHPSVIDIEEICLTSDNCEAIRDADLVVIAVKPWVLPTVAEEIAPHLSKDTEVTAIVAGVSGHDLSMMFGTHCPSVLSIAMPNTAMSVGESMTFIVDVAGTADRAVKIFSRLGSVEIIEERLLRGATALASCGIAYAMRYVRAATEGGVELGFKAAAAQRIVAQTLRGAVALLDREGSHPEAEIDKVTTPGGLTIRGLNAMERAGFTTAVIEGLKNSI